MCSPEKTRWFHSPLISRCKKWTLHASISGMLIVLWVRDVFISHWKCSRRQHKIALIQSISRKSFAMAFLDWYLSHMFLKKKLVEGQLTPVHVLLEWSALGVSHIHNCHILQVYIEASETELFWQKQDSGYHSHYWLGQYHANSQTLFSVQAHAALIDFGTRQPLSFILHVFQLEGCNES